MNTSEINTVISNTSIMDFENIELGNVEDFMSVIFFIFLFYI